MRMCATRAHAHTRALNRLCVHVVYGRIGHKEEDSSGFGARHRDNDRRGRKPNRGDAKFPFPQHIA